MRHKPTWGVVPQQGHQLPGTECIDTLDIAAAGPLARSTHDLTLAMDILATPLKAFGPMGWVPAAWRDSGVPTPRLRVAVLDDDACAEVDASVREQLRGLAGFLRSRGLTVTEQARPVDSAEAWETYVHLLRAATGAQLDDAQYAQARAHAADHASGSRDFAARNWRGVMLSHRDWVHHDDVRSKLRRQWATFFETWDLLICPVATTPAFKQNQQGFRWHRMLPVNGHEQPSTSSLFWAGYPGRVGLPATAVPLGLSSDGLPIGAQVIGPAFADPACLRFARWLETEYRAFVPPPMAVAG